ncbi:MAG: YcbK family protein [Hyphomicrobiaceae bacterium]
MNLISKAASLALAVLLAFGAGVSAPIDHAHARGYTKTHAKQHSGQRHSSHRAHRKAKHATAKHRSASKSRHARSSSRKKSRKSASYRHHRMSLGAMSTTHTRRAHAPSRSSGGVSWSASSSCLNAALRGVVHQVAAQFGSLRVNSTCRSKSHNRRVGGARHSHHIGGNAVDFRVFGNVRAVASYLRSNGSVGGYKHYGGGLFHIDTGPRRSW